MSAVSVLLVVLIGAINALSWYFLDNESDNVLRAIADGEEKFIQLEPHGKAPFFRQPDMDTLKSARFFMVCTDLDGNIESINIDQISSVDASQAAQYTEFATGESGKVGNYKYKVKSLNSQKLIFFMDISDQVRTFAMVFTLSSVIALICWLATLGFVLIFSKKAVRPILAGMEKQKQFITNAGHELKTPLSIIQSNNDASTLIYGETKYSKNIRAQTKRLSLLMSDLLTLAKLDEEVQLPKEDVDISELIMQFVPTCEDGAKEKNIDFSFSIQPHVFMYVHEETFSRMISAILDNAVKYTPCGGKIFLELTSDLKKVKIVEENTCIVPENADAERLFERFYRADSARTQDGTVSGYGIGLSASRAIAETFGGTLKAEYTCDSIRFVASF